MTPYSRRLDLGLLHLLDESLWITSSYIQLNDIKVWIAKVIVYIVLMFSLLRDLRN